MKNVVIYTDGSCLGNPGYGGWSAILIYKETLKTLSGFSKKITTNNRMELQAILKGLTYLKEPCSVTIYTDSNYCVNVINAHIKTKTISRDTTNIDIISKIIPYLNRHSVKFKIIRGHCGIQMNELADCLAKAQAEKARYRLFKGGEA